MTSQIEHPVADEPPWSETLTDYDQHHLVTYLRLLDADQTAPTGARRRAWSWAAIPTKRPVLVAVAGKPIWRAPAG